MMVVALALSAGCGDNDNDGGGTGVTPTPVRTSTPGVTATPVATATPGGGGLANVSFTVSASAQAQAFKVEVGYPTAKGSFTGSADTTGCTTGDAGIFLPNDNDSGKLILVASEAVGALGFPVVINCTFDQADGQTLAAGDLTPVVTEVTDTEANPLPLNTISVGPAVS
jgi:hypothetical protein